MIITVTERGTFRRCKRQWDYSSFNRQGLTSIVPPTALSFGGIVHKCHEQWLLLPEEPVQDLVMKVGAQGVRELKERYTEIVGVEPAPEELKSYFDQLELALEIMTNYEKKWGSSLPDGYELLQPEQTILMPIPGTEHVHESDAIRATYTPDQLHPHGPGECVESAGYWLHQLEGTLDALMRDEGGMIWVLERKTYGNRPKIETLQMNDQFLAYAWLLSQLNIGPVGGIFYDGMWKRAWEKNRTLDDLFMREPLLRSPEEVANFGIQVRDEALDMTDPDLRIYPNRAWMGCWDCQFEKLCAAQSRGEDFDYIKSRYFTTRTRSEWQEADAAE
jgi:hypothetical protein